ncbi:FAD-binding oxidoreductase [Pseudooceanicola sediminis]|uniref:FAD-binding oxidoreductase n=1 Tax=Pseudooceanicola sediminis TaxID=2211117 RepID=A0A399J647_9RHOB|nr:FAD-binding oxidoreductase [Pseudooceanicola sediminis]KAA2313436.1 FAD-binding oxidoreductase [Puniceibacterium sp. HSS470]RII38286.1 FAD-binding oxidoreductase [Pseudooceanicola sediminis]|tara:strand:+ start:20019 stop:21431 length:1413 start_codon:yes stop_codon:yes gene_type:complete
MLDQLTARLGPANVLTGKDAEPYGWDWSHESFQAPLAVVRPASTEEVSAVVKWANATRTPLVPAGGRTGMAGGAQGEGAVVVSLERMNRIRDMRPEARSIVVEAGVIIAKIHETVEPHGLIFPLSFGARGSAMIGGALATNAGGSNVLRYGNTRDLVLGIEAVLPNGDVVDLMHDLHKNNSGYDLRHLLIGSEGTLGIITGAVLRLRSKPGAYATALVGMKSLASALDLLNRIQLATGGAVEAFEFMPDTYVADYQRLRATARPPFAENHKVNILIEIGALAPRDCTPLADGSMPIVSYLEEVLAQMHDAGAIEDALIATSQSQRSEMWAMREAASEVAAMKKPMIIMDVAVPVDRMDAFIARADNALAQLDSQATTSVVAHLGDGNIHYTIFPGSPVAAHKDSLVEAIEDVVADLKGSFSAEHGIGTHKLSTMARRKDPAALAAMHAIKRALDPNGIMNPGKLLPLLED